MNQKQRASQFLKMHHADQLLILPNCWDAISAKVLADTGFAAIATASASISWARGKKDGEGLSRAEMIDAIALCCKGVDVPVTADIEKGFGETPGDVEETVSQVLKAGAVGINIEDSLVDGGQREISDMQERIMAARTAGQRAGVELVINARADGFLLGGSGNEVFNNTILRAAAWREAGADCIFIPGVSDLALIEKLTKAIKSPVNVLVSDENMPNVDDLANAGVARVSTGPRLMQAVMGALYDVVESVQKNHDFRFLKNCPGFADLNKL